MIAILQAARATPAGHSPIGWEYYEEGKLIRTYDSAENADHAKKMFGGVVRPIYAQPPQNAADHIEAQSVRNAVIEECITACEKERLEGGSDCPEDDAYENAIKDCIFALQMVAAKPAAPPPETSKR